VEAVKQGAYSSVPIRKGQLTDIYLPRNSQLHWIVVIVGVIPIFKSDIYRSDEKVQFFRRPPSLLKTKGRSQVG